MQHRPRKNEAIMSFALKHGGDELVDEIVGMSNDIHEILQKQDQFAEDLAELKEKLEKGFVAGDVEGHRRWHELQIRKVEEVRRLRIAIQEKTISGLIWAAIITLGSLLWSGVKARLF